MLPSHSIQQPTDVLGTTMAQAAQAGESILGQVLAQTSAALATRATQTRDPRDRDTFLLGIQLLQAHAAMLLERYPVALAAAWAHGAGQVSGSARSLANLHFDELELLDSDEVQGRVDLAKAQQITLLAADGALTEFNRFMSGLLGLSYVQPERNPVRPEVFCEVLQSLLVQTQAPLRVRTEWLRHMSEPLGKALAALYRNLSQGFQKTGVVAVSASFGAVRRRPDAAPVAPSQSSPQLSPGKSSDTPPDTPRGTPLPQRASQDGPEQTLLTLERLRGLLLGELDAVPTHGAQPFAVSESSREFARQFAHQFESTPRSEPPATDFQSTVPAALQALQDMQQVDHMVDRLGQRQVQPGESGRARVQRSALGLGQLLSLEVVALMVDNIVRDTRWLAPVRALVKRLEPALLSLALVDRRFFSDKQHPARRLLQELTHRSLAFDVADGPGYMLFWATVERAVNPLLTQDVDSAQPFEQALQDLLEGCEASATHVPIHEAVQALQKAEERHLLAEKMGQDIRAGLNVDALDPRVVSFLVGPWAQVMAQARLLDTTGSDDPDHYLELVAALAWSAQPAKTRKNINRLTQLVPKLLGKLREGLGLIDYPAVKTSAFFDVLMKLHQQAFRPSTAGAGAGVAAKGIAVARTDEAADATDGTDAVADIEPPQPSGLAPSLQQDDELWLAPDEVRVSGFMSLPDAAPEPDVAEVTPQQAGVDTADVPIPCTEPVPDAVLGVGAWVELWVDEAWMRTQVSWASPHGTLFLFTSAQGSTQSMTRRSRDRVWAQGRLRLVSGQPVVDSALDAVLETAMRNSLSLNH